MNEEMSKEELEKEMHEKNAALLRKSGGVEGMVSFNLENFAFRYIETDFSSNIKCMSKNKEIWVESYEKNILSALKWKNPEVKKVLLELCKNNPGSKSKEIHIKQVIGTVLNSEEKVTCFSYIDWGFPEFRDPFKRLEKRQVFSFDDPIILRNKHAAILEDVCEIFY